MFAFQKNNALTTSNQSSVDSLVISPSTSISVSDVGASQSSETSYEDPSSPEQRLGSFHGKRHSVFTLRSRSNTATSTTSLSPSMAGIETSSARSLFKSKKSKRLSGSFPPHPHTHDQDESQIGTKRISMLRKTRKHSEQLENSAPPWKNRISSPFDFQHLTHTNRHHFAALQEASENELAAGFSAVRASQAPQRKLSGIKAENLPSSSVSTEDLTTPERRSISAMELRPPEDSIDHVDAQEPTPAQQRPTRPSLRQTRSVDSFSRPGVNARMHRHTQSANAPSRVSSRLPVAGQTDAQDTAPIQTNRQSGVWDDLVPLSPMRTGSQLPSMTEEPDYVGHALTTPDNSAIHTLSPPFSPGLEDVAEEPERFVSPRPAPQPPNRSPKSPKSPRSPFQGSSFFSHRSPPSKSHNRKDSWVLPRQMNQMQNGARPMSPMSDTLTSPGLTRRHSIRKAPCARRGSNTWKGIEDSWEDDIDYIYENALEAECELDWERSPGQGTGNDGDRTPEQESYRRASTVTSNVSSAPSPVIGEESEFFAGNFRSSLLVPNTSSVPDLEPRSAISNSTVDTNVHTPSDYFTPSGILHAPFGEPNRFSFTPSLLGPQEYKEHILREELYDNLLADYEGSDRHFPLLESTRSITSSRRSSHVRTSKRSSNDSSLISSGHGSGSWTAGVGIRRSASSAGSLPELVHSSRAPRQNTSTAADKLPEHAISFTNQDEDNVEDNDVTPPGHGSQERTFFASDDEHDSVDSAQATLNMEMKTSLELARQGSNGSSGPTRKYHKYTSSEGAAKLLASPNKTAAKSSRTRAGSVPQKGQTQYLSLFPAPPKRPTVSPKTSPLGPAST